MTEYTFLDYSKDKYIGSFFCNGVMLKTNEVCDLLNKQEETINELKTRNKRQYDLLKKLSDLMYKRDWKSLEKIVEDWEESDRLLQAEFKCCDGDVE